MSDLREAIIKLAQEKPEFRAFLVPVLRRTADLSRTEEGAKKMYERYKAQHPKTKKRPQDFFDPSKAKKEPEKAPAKSPEKSPENDSGKTPTKAPASKGVKTKSLFKSYDHLPELVTQPTKDKAEIMKQGVKAHEHQLDWLNRGKGIDSIIGATVVRTDQDGSLPDYSKPGPIVVIGPMKKEARAAEKVEADFDGDWSKLGDVVRASIAVDKFSDLESLVKTLEKSGMELARKPKDRFAKPTEAGYRDVLLSVKHPNGHVGELQLHVKSMLKAKDEAHKFYEEVRTIESKAKKAGRTTLSAEEQATVDEANKKMEALYDAAWKEASGTKKEKAPKGEAAKGKQAFASGKKFFEYEDQVVVLENRKFPRYRDSGKTIYDLESFFREAHPLTEDEAEDHKKK